MLFKSILKKLGYGVAALIILFAILFVTARLITPALETHHAEIEKWGSDLLDRPIKIEKMNLTWRGYQPVVSLKNVTVLDKASSEPILQVKEVSVYFSVPRSLWSWRPVPAGLMISGADINVYETATGEYAVQGFPAIGGFDDQPYAREAKFTETLAWLAEQNRLVLRDIDIRYKGFNGQKRLISLRDLRLINSPLSHVVLGKAVLQQELPTEVEVVIEWNGQPIDLAHIKAKAYLYVSGFSIPQWLKDYTVQGWQVKEGVASAKIWASWDHGAFDYLQSVFQLHQLNLYSETNKSTHKIRRISGDIGWKRDGNNQVIAADDILIDLPGHLWPMTSFNLTLVPESVPSIAPSSNTRLIPKTLRIGYLDLQDIQPFLFSSPAMMSEEMHHLISELKLKGTLQDTAVAFPTAWNDWKRIKVNTDFNHIYFAPRQSMPGIMNATGGMKWDGSKGVVTLNSHQFVFNYPAIFDAPLTVDQLSGDIAFQQNEAKAWIFNLQKIQVLNNDAAANASGSITLPESGSTNVDLKANFAFEEAKRINHYLPMKVFEPGLAKWLKQAFLSGEVKSGNAVLRGPLNAFPFDKNNGEFLITANVVHLDFRYAPDWPLLKQISAQITFAGRKIEIDVKRASLLGMPAQNAHGVIPYMGDEKPAILTVDCKDINADFSQGLRLVRESPLKDSIGKMFTNMSVKGPIKVQLGLTVPLANPDATQVRGDITIDNATMDLSPWGLVLKQLSGNVAFTEKTTSAQGIQAMLFDKPVQFDLLTIEKANIPSVVQAKFTTRLAISDIQDWLKLPLAKFAKGETAVKGEIDLSTQLPIEIRLQSRLQGISLDLPDQYGKNVKQEVAFSTTIIAPEKKPLQVKFLYGDLLGSALTLEKKKNKFQLIGANLHLGAGDPAWPTAPGMQITGTIDEFNWDKVKGYMGESQDSSLAGLVFRGADVQFKKLSVFGQELTQPQIKVVPSENSWHISINSEDVSGSMDIPKIFNRTGQISAQFDKLILHVNKDAKTSPLALQVKSLPALALTMNHVSYNDMPLGQVILKTSPSANGQTIQSVRINSPRISFQASGNWMQNHTHLQGKADSPHVGELLASIDIDAHNFVANKGHLEFDLTWQDAFYSPALASMNGEISLDLGPGRIVDVGQDADAKMGIGRMLSLFSLQTIPRRLSLDFSDVFQKGYSFDNIRGDFKLKNGNAYTNNLHFNGPVASLDINGRIGLNNKDFDLTLGITPMDVTSGIPLAAAYLTGPVGGIAALAVNTVIGKQISRAATYHYEVKGPWSNPSFDQVKNVDAR